MTSECLTILHRNVFIEPPNICIVMFANSPKHGHYTVDIQQTDTL